MFARVSTYRGGDADKLTQGFNSVSVEQLPGFAGAHLLVDRSSGKAMTITFWESEDALTSSVEKAERMRKSAADTGGASIDSVDHYEVAMTKHAPTSA